MVTNGETVEEERFMASVENFCNETSWKILSKEETIALACLQSLLRNETYVPSAKKVDEAFEIAKEFLNASKRNA